jgi:hypothetical protein
LGLILPWAVGVQVNRDGISWGPGFELKAYNYPEVEDTQFKLTFGPGMAFPTPEGPRPLYGHGFVLLGEWKEFINSLAAERQNTIDTALRNSIPLISIGWSPDYYLNNLYAMGFQTSDSHNRTAADGYFYERRFTNAQGERIFLIIQDIVGSDIDELISHLKQYTGSDEIVVIGHPQTLRAIYKGHPNMLHALGPTSAIMDLRELSAE